MKAGDIVMIFGNPIKLEHPIGQARLVSLLSSHPTNLEYWEVEYLDSPEHRYQALIKKDNGKNKKT
jgi:hypothetical protein